MLDSRYEKLCCVSEFPKIFSPFPFLPLPSLIATCRFLGDRRVPQQGALGGDRHRRGSGNRRSRGNHGHTRGAVLQKQGEDQVRMRKNPIRIRLRTRKWNGTWNLGLRWELEIGIRTEVKIDSWDENGIIIIKNVIRKIRKMWYRHIWCATPLGLLLRKDLDGYTISTYLVASGFGSSIQLRFQGLCSPFTYSRTCSLCH